MKEITEIQPNLYCIELPLPNSPLKSINCYVVKGNKRSLIIDTGMNRPECKAVLFPALKELGVQAGGYDIFITHLHADHYGLSGDLATDGSKCYLGQDDVSIIKNTQHWLEIYTQYVENGFPESVIKESMARHPGVLYNTKRIVDITPVITGQKIQMGEFLLECIGTPGHSPGHMCLYDSGKKLFFSGDHVLFDITPNITCWPEMKDSLRSYLSNLDNVADLEVANVLPGHRRPWHNHRQRIEELKKHHRHRLDEAIAALKNKDMTAYEVAPHITWKIEFRDWNDFPIAQKFFAVGETVAHLRYLETDGVIRSHTKDGRTYFSLV